MSLTEEAPPSDIVKEGNNQMTVKSNGFNIFQQQMQSRPLMVASDVSSNNLYINTIGHPPRAPSTIATWQAPPGIVVSPPPSQLRREIDDKWEAIIYNKPTILESEVRLG